MNNIAPKLQQCYTQKIAFKIIFLNAKATKFLLQSAFYTSKKGLAKFSLSTTFGLSFMISSVAPTRSSTSYAYLITKIGNRNLKHTTHKPGLFLNSFFFHVLRWVVILLLLDKHSAIKSHELRCPWASHQKWMLLHTPPSPQHTHTHAHTHTRTHSHTHARTHTHTHTHTHTYTHTHTHTKETEHIAF